MSWQNLILLAIFLLGCFSGIYSSCVITDGGGQANPYSGKLWSQAIDVRSTASRLLDSGRILEANKLYNKIMAEVNEPVLSRFANAKTDARQEISSEERVTVARDFNNQAVALFLAAKFQPDPQVSSKELSLAGDCLLLGEQLSGDLEALKLPLLYNRSIVLLHQGRESNADRLMSRASLTRMQLDPVLKQGLLP